MANPFSKEAKRADKIKRTLFFILSAVIFFMAVIVIFLPGNYNKKTNDSSETIEEVFDSTSEVGKDSTFVSPANPRHIQNPIGKKVKDDDKDEYDPYDDPDFDDNFPGEEHEEEFLGNEGDPQIYNEK